MVLDPREARKRYLLRVAGARDGKVYIGPEMVDLHVTDRCNLACQYCWYHGMRAPGPAKPAKNFSFSKFKQIVADSIDMRVDRICVSGEGEPTLHPEFSEMMKLLSMTPLFVVLHSNGTFAAERCADVRKADLVMINLGAVDRAGYQLLQGRDLFHKVINNIEKLVHFRNRSKPALKIGVTFVINKINIGIRPRMEVLIRDLGVDYFNATQMSPTSRTAALLPGAEAMKGARKIKRSCSLCYNGWFHASLNLAGKLSMCCQIDDMEIADMNRMSFREAWFSVAFMRARLNGKAGRLHRKFEECLMCGSWEQNMKVRKILMAIG